MILIECMQIDLKNIAKKAIGQEEYEEVYFGVKQTSGFVVMEEVYRRLNQIKEGWGDLARQVDKSKIAQ